VWTVLDQGLSFCFGRWLVDVVWTRSWKGGRRPRHVLARSVEPWIFPIKTHWVSNCNCPCPSCDFQLSRTWLSEKWDDSCSLAHFSCFHVFMFFVAVLLSPLRPVQASSTWTNHFGVRHSEHGMTPGGPGQCVARKWSKTMGQLEKFCFHARTSVFLHKKRVELRSVQHTLWTFWTVDHVFCLNQTIRTVQRTFKTQCGAGMSWPSSWWTAHASSACPKNRCWLLICAALVDTAVQVWAVWHGSLLWDWNVVKWCLPQNTTDTMRIHEMIEISIWSYSIRMY
jgi:hypothetical protein